MDVLERGEDPFARPRREREVWAAAASVISGAHSRALVRAIEDSWVRIKDRSAAHATLLAGVRGTDALTATEAAAVALAHHDALDDAGRSLLGTALRAGAEDRTDRYRSSRMLELLVIYSGVEPTVLHPAITIAQDRRGLELESWEAESVVTVLGALDSLHPEDGLRDLISAWSSHSNPFVQAEAQTQLGRAWVRRAAEADALGGDLLERARVAFGNASQVEERTDAVVWQNVVRLLLLLERGLASPAEIGEAVGVIRALGRERLQLAFEGEGFWRLREDQLLLYAGERLAALAATFEHIDAAPSLVGALELLAAAARQPPLPFDRTSAALARLWHSGVLGATSATLDSRVQNARRKVEAVVAALEADAADRAVLMELATRLDAFESARVSGVSPPKVEGVASGGAAPDLAQLLLALDIADRLGQRGGYPIASEILVGLIAQLRKLVGSIPADALALVTVGLELLVGFVVQRTIDPTLRGTGREDYLYASPDGLGPRAVEEHVRRDYLRYILSSDYAWLADKEQLQMDGRADVRLVYNGLPLTTETKRELTDASRSAIDTNYLPQAQSYVPNGPRIGFLLVLDLTARVADPDVRERFWVSRYPAAVGSGEHPDFVVIAVLSGNRRPPHERRASAVDVKASSRTT